MKYLGLRTLQSILLFRYKDINQANIFTLSCYFQFDYF